jgi:malonyl-CoA decarboxylase
MMPMQVSFFRELLETIFERRRALGPPAAAGRVAISPSSPASSCRAAASCRGVAIAQQIVETYERLTAPRSGVLPPARHRIRSRCRRRPRRREPVSGQWRCRRAVPAGAPGRGAPAEFFRRLNLAPGGTAAMVAMRAELLPLVADDPF